SRVEATRSDIVEPPWNHRRPFCRQLRAKRKLAWLIARQTTSPWRQMFLTECPARTAQRRVFLEVPHDRQEDRDSERAPALAVLASLDRLGSYVVPGDDPERPRADLKRGRQWRSALGLTACGFMISAIPMPALVWVVV